MDRLTVLERMRESWRNGDVKSLKRQLAIGSWWLTDEDKLKIERAIHDLENKDHKNLPPMVKEALRILGGRIID